MSEEIRVKKLTGKANSGSHGRKKTTEAFINNTNKRKFAREKGQSTKDPMGRTTVAEKRTGRSTVARRLRW